MKLNRLCTKAIISYSLSLVVLLAFFAFAQKGTVRITEDEVINNILHMEAESYLQCYAQNPDAPLPSMTNLQVITDESRLPPDFTPPLSKLRDGTYETNGPASIDGPPAHNILIKTFPAEDRRLYLIYNADQVISRQTCTLGSKSILIITFVCTAFIGVILSFIIGKIIFHPLNSLTANLLKYDPQGIDKEFTEAARNDEIGLLASSIQSSFRQVRKYVQREREFTRDASHELRTPLSVIKGAMELIKSSHPAEAEQAKRPLARIERAANTMGETIETLLWLAREEATPPSVDEFEIPDVIRQSVLNLAPLTERKQVTIHTEIGICMPNRAPKQVLLITFSNILNNALNFTPGGVVSIDASGSRISVKDTGAGIPEELLNKLSSPYVKGTNSSGFGLGLSIVNRLCNRFGWELEISQREQGGTSVTIDLSATASRQGHDQHKS